MKKELYSLLTIHVLATILVFTGCTNNENKDKIPMANEMNTVHDNNKVRLSLITVDSTQLSEYKSFLKEEIETSMKVEPGVLALYAVSEKDNSNKITILEIYADEEAYQKHIKTPHFIKYKEGTLNMVQSLKLIDTTPLIPGLKMK